MGIAKRAINLVVRGKRLAKINRELNRGEIRRKVVRLKTHPYIMVLEPASMCNLRCPLCPTGNGMLGIKKELLTRETFGAIMSNMEVKYLLQANLFNWGEPLLNPHIFDYIKFFSERGIFTSIHTNFSAKDYNEGYFKAIVESGLDELIVSVDGASQETYEKYRVGGNFARVVANISGVSTVKERSGSSTPDVVYKMLVNKFNESEVDRARTLAEELGARFKLDENFDVPAHVRDEWVAESVKEKYGDGQQLLMSREASEEISMYCRQMWDTLVVNANGDAFPCCLAADEAMAVGNLAREGADGIWNNEKMVSLRRFVIDGDAEEPDFANLCERCSYRYCLQKGERQ
jgi:radical SAM protein with 4Fe4S-binding SPASM domain